MLVFLVILKFNILDLPRHYAQSGDLESAIRAYSEIYRTANDSIIKYQALYEQSELYLKKGDTISALVNLYRLQSRYLPDSLAGKVFSRLFTLDKTRLGKNATLFAMLYPYVKGRRNLLERLLVRLKKEKDTASYLAVLRVLASDYGGKYKKNLSEFVYKNNLETHVFQNLFHEYAKAPFFYYMHKNDVFTAFYTLFGRMDAESRKLRLKILYDLGAYNACYNLVSDVEKDPDVVKIKLLSAVKMRMRADSIIMLVKKYKRNRKLYNKLVNLLDTLPEYGLLRAYFKGDIQGIIFHGLRTQGGLRDSIFLETAINLTREGEYSLAKELIRSVNRYYPYDRVLMWKKFIMSKRKMPQDILLGKYDAMGKVKELFENKYYAELVQYAKGKELPKQAVHYVVESLYMLWKLYGRKGYLKSAFLLSEKYKASIPRDLYLKVVLDYAPSKFDVERYSYGNLSKNEVYMLYFLLKAQNKSGLIKDFGTGKYYKYLYGLSIGNVDSALSYLPDDEKFAGLFFKEIKVSNREDSLKVLKHFEHLNLDYLKYPSKDIIMKTIEYAISLDDVLGADSLLEKYKTYYGMDRFYTYSRARWYFNMGEYQKALLYSLFHNEDRFQFLTAACLLKLGKIDAVSNLALDNYSRNLLYLKTGMLKRVKVSLLDREDALYYLKELTKGNYSTHYIAAKLSDMVKEGIIDSMTYAAYGIFIGALKKDSVYLNSYGRSLLTFLRVKRLMRQNKLDSALLVIGNPEEAVDTLKYHLYFKKGTILYIKRQYRDAMKDYLKAAELESLRDAAIFNAYLSAKRGNLKRKVIALLEDYTQQCITCDKLPDAYISLGFNYIELGQPDSAILQLSKVEGYLSPEQEAELKYWLGTAYMQDSVFMQAEGYFSRVYRFHQKSGQWGDTGGLNAARLLYALGLKEEAVSIYRSIIRRRKNDALAQEAKKELSVIK